MRPGTWAAAAAMTVSAGAMAQPCEERWETMVSTAIENGVVRAAARFDAGDGAGPLLYVGGEFSVYDAVAGRHQYSIARWTGERWEGVARWPAIVTAAVCWDLAVWDDDGDGPNPPKLYAAREQTGLAAWDGTNWTSIPGMLRGGTGRALTVFDDGRGPALYVAGHLGLIRDGTVVYSSVVRFDGSTLEQLSASNGLVTGLCAAPADAPGGSALFATGQFVSLGGTPARNIARWANGSWHALGAGVDGIGYTMLVHDDGSGAGPRLFVGGDIGVAGSSPAQSVAAWDGTEWAPVGDGLESDGDDFVRMLAVHDFGDGARLVAGGQFTRSGTISVRGLAAWDGKAWSEVGGGVDPSVREVRGNVSHGEPLLITGDFVSAGGRAAQRVAAWDGSRFQSVGVAMGPNGPVEEVVEADLGTGRALYVGGRFTTAGEVRSSGAARLDDSGWSAMSGLTYSSSVSVMAAYRAPGEAHASLYAAGPLRVESDPSIWLLARWDGESWSGVGSGIEPEDQEPGVQGVSSMVVYDDGSGPALYVAGLFRTRADPTIALIARWNGIEWSRVGEVPFEGRVSSLGVYDHGDGPKLYATGVHVLPSGSEFRFAARWDGNAWTLVDNGFFGCNHFVSMAVARIGGATRLYAAGCQFPIAGGGHSNLLAYDGRAWTAPDQGTCFDVNCADIRSLSALEDRFGPALVAGGVFAMIGGREISTLARWNGSAWTGMGATLDGEVSSTAAVREGGRTRLWVGGTFLVDGRLSRLASYLACPACAPDWNLDGALNSSDFFDFLDDFFAADQGTGGDFNRSGRTDSQDFFDFLTHYFGGCP